MPFIYFILAQEGLTNLFTMDSRKNPISSQTFRAVDQWNKLLSLVPVVCFLWQPWLFAARPISAPSLRWVTMRFALSPLTLLVRVFLSITIRTLHCWMFRLSWPVKHTCHTQTRSQNVWSEPVRKKSFSSKVANRSREPQQGQASYWMTDSTL